MSRGKVTEEERIKAAKGVVEGKISITEIARRLGMNHITVIEWVARYRENGPTAFLETGYNAVYSEGLKICAVREYLEGKGSRREIAAKYGLRSSSQLRNWIIWYNSGRDLKRKMSGGSRMKQGRETTQEERVAIAKDCMENGSNYGETAIKYNVSYQQVYTWVKKLRELGEAGLEDRRGQKTAAQESRTELEELKIKMAQLEHRTICYEWSVTC